MHLMAKRSIRKMVMLWPGSCGICMGVNMQREHLPGNMQNYYIMNCIKTLIQISFLNSG